MIMISPSAVHSTEQSSYCWQKATNSSSVIGTPLGFRITGAIDSKSSTTNCMSPVYAVAYATLQFDYDGTAPFLEVLRIAQIALALQRLHEPGSRHLALL